MKLVFWPTNLHFTLEVVFNIGWFQGAEVALHEKKKQKQPPEVFLKILQISQLSTSIGFSF